MRGLCFPRFPAISKARWDNRKAPQASRESRPHCKRVRSFHGTTILKLIIGLKLACFESIVQSKRLSLRQNCIVINTTDFKSIRRNFTAFELTFVKALPLPAFLRKSRAGAHHYGGMDSGHGLRTRLIFLFSAPFFTCSALLRCDVIHDAVYAARSKRHVTLLSPPFR